MSGDVSGPGRGKARGRGRGTHVISAPVAGSSGISKPIGRASRTVDTSGLTQKMSRLELPGSVKAGGGNGGSNDGPPAGRGSTRSSRTQAHSIDVTIPDWVKQRESGKMGNEGERRKIQANLFSFKQIQKWTLYRHHVDFSPEEDRTNIRQKLLGEHREKIGRGYLFDGSTIFSAQPLCDEKTTLTFTSIRQHDNQQIKISIKRAGTCHDTDAQNTQVFNIILRKCLGSLGLQCIRRNYYDPSASVHIAEHNLELWPGIIASIAQYETDILLLAEINYKVLRTDTVYQEMMKVKSNSRGGDVKTEIKNIIMGSVVMTTYNKKTYRVDDVDFSVNPESTFPRRTREGSENVKYCDYFAQRYDCKIRDLRQPLLVSRASQRAIRAGEREIIYLIPELCVMTGLSDDMRKNHTLMRAAAQHTAVDPANRVQRLLNYGKRLLTEPKVKFTLNQWGMELIPKLVEADGRVFTPETIFVGDGKKCSAGVHVDWTKNLRDSKVLHPVPITKWIIVYPPRAENDAGKLLQELTKVGRPMGIVFPAPVRCKLRGDSVSDFVQESEKAINTNNPALVVFVVPNNNSARYAAVKKKCILDKSVPSQVVTCKSINSKTFTSIATKIAIQINCKLGGAPWAVDIPPKNLMIVGYDVCHDPKDKRKSFGAMVATSDSTYARYFSAVKNHPSGEELSLNFGLNLQLAVKNYHSKNGTLPGRIIIYRDGVGEGSLNYVKEQEVKNIQDRLKEFYQSVSVDPPKLTFVVVTKRIHVRLFDNGKNPQPGTVVDNVVTNPFMYDFYLVSQSVRQGTVSPTHYNVIYDDVRLAPGLMQKLTYKLTHMYYNWSGTVRVPAPCQYAHKLAFLTSQSVGSDHSNLNNLLYFL